MRVIFVARSGKETNSAMRNSIKPCRKLTVCLSLCLICGPIAAAIAATAVSELPSRGEVRSLLKELPPGERESKIRGLRAEYGSVGQAYGRGRDSAGGMGQQARERMARFQREIQDLPPEEREARINEMRQRFGGGMPVPGRPGVKSEEVDLSRLSPAQRVEFLKLRRKLSELPAEERDSKMREFLSKAGLDAASVGVQGGRLSPGMAGELGDKEGHERFQQMREQAQERIANLEKKKADGSITEQEERLLERMKQFGERRGKAGDLNRPGLPRR